MSTQNPIRVGIIGLGRSGWNIHSKAIRNQPETFTVVGVCDPFEERARQAVSELGCTAHDSVESLLADSDVELAIVASPNGYHANHAVAALEAGKHVLCEKPFGLTTADVDRMMAAAEKAGKVLQPFQQRRWEPDFQKVKAICDSGILGEIQFIRICWHNFKRRWDWQTTKEMDGGALNNNGPHPIDHAMELFGGDDPEVLCEMRRVLCSGDAEDFLKVTLRGPGRPTVEVELMDAIAYPQDRWLVAGNAGGLRGTGNFLEWKWVDWSAMPERPVSLEPTPDRSYNSEKLSWRSDSWQPEEKSDAGAGAAPSPAPVLTLYANLYEVIRNGAKQDITAADVRSRLLVLERARAASEMY
jgi:predicted dehydrogenase